MSYPFERRHEVKKTTSLFVGVHLNPDVLDKEWVHGRLKLQSSKERSKKVQEHLDGCENCRGTVASIEWQDRKNDGKSRGIPPGDR